MDAMPDMHINGFDDDKKGNIWISIGNSIRMFDSMALSKGKLQLTALPASWQKLSDLHGSSFAFDDHNVWVLYNPLEIIRAGK